MHNRLHKHILTLMAASMLLYLAKITAISPVYAIYLALSPFTLAYFLNTLKEQMPVDSLTLIALLILITTLNLENLASGEYINLFLGINAYIYIRSLRKKFIITDWIKLINVAGFAAIILLGADTIYRLTHPTTPTEEAGQAIAQDESLWFYPYKFGTLMFADSNTTGLAAMIVLFLIIGARSAAKIPVFRWDTGALLALIALSISRSAIAATLIGLCYYSIKTSTLKYRFRVGVFTSIIAAISTPIALSSLLASQGSLLSKFHILNTTINYISNTSIDSILFGIGLGESINLFGIHTHLIYLTYLIEGGAISLIIFLLFFGIYIRHNGLVTTLPFLLASASYFLYLGSPFLFVPMAMYANITFLTKKRKSKTPNSHHPLLASTSLKHSREA